MLPPAEPRGEIGPASKPRGGLPSPRFFIPLVLHAVRSSRPAAGAAFLPVSSTVFLPRITMDCRGRFFSPRTCRKKREDCQLLLKCSLSSFSTRNRPDHPVVRGETLLGTPMFGFVQAQYFFFRRLTHVPLFSRPLEGFFRLFWKYKPLGLLFEQKGAPDPPLSSVAPIKASSCISRPLPFRRKIRAL